MPKQAKSSTAKIRQICQEHLDKFLATPVGNLQCNLCDVLVKCDRRLFVESHWKSKQHQERLETKSKSQSKLIFLQLDQVNFKEQVVSSFLDTDLTILRYIFRCKYFINWTILLWSLCLLQWKKYCLRRLQPGHVLLN